MILELLCDNSGHYMYHQV